MHVLLAEPDYYTRFPPLGLLKLSAYHKQRGDTVELVRGSHYPKERPSLIYVTSLFTWAWKPVWNAVRWCKAWFPNAEVYLGGLYASLLPEHAKGSGADHVHEGLFMDAEDLCPDYELVPEWDGSIIFSSRGCPKECGYCGVPKLEGKINSVKHGIKHLVWPKHTRIIFFDNNILASPGWRSVFDELLELGLKVDFNQGLDASLITEEVAEKISKMRLDSFVRLAYDYHGVGPVIEKAIERLRAYGISKRKIMVYALFNYNGSPDEFFERVKEILRWGVVCYPMRYEPLDTLEKNRYVSPKWDAKRVDMVQRARRVIGYGGAFPPYEGLVRKFEKAEGFDEAFSLYPLKRGPPK